MSHRAAKQERMAQREVSKPARIAERGDARRCHPHRQWRPPDRPVNSCLPKTLRLAEDFFSAQRWRVIEAMTTKAAPDKTTRMPDNSWLTTMSYGLAAILAGVCVKTVRNTIRQALDIGLYSIECRNMDGGRYKATTYRVKAFGAFLIAVRNNPAYFHTADGHVAGIGRNPRIMQPGDAEVWKIKPNLPPAPRSAGPRGAARPEAPRKATQEDIDRVTDGLRRSGTVADAADAGKVIQAAIAAGKQFGVAGQIDAMLVEGIILAIGRDYRPNAAFPVPTIGWYIKQIPGRIKAWAARIRGPG